MILNRSRVHGITVVETAVVIAVGTVVFGLILGSVVQTSRASTDVMTAQQMRQESLLISQSLERLIRYRIDAQDLELAQAAPAATPGSAALATATTATATSTIPKSLQDTLVTTAPAAQATPSAARTPTAAELTSVPATLKPLFITTTETAALRPVLGPEERYAPDELTLFSVAGAEKSNRASGASIQASVRNSRGLPSDPRHAYVEWRSPGQPGETARPLGSNSDKLQSSVSFRYASDFDGVNARWQTSSAQVPRLIEYTIRVWLRSAGPEFVRRDAAGRSTGFEYTSAVEVR